MITRLPIDQPDVVTGPILAREPRMLAVARDHPLAARPSASLEDIGDHRIASLNEIAPKELADAYVPPKTPSGRPIKHVRVTVQSFRDLVVLIARGKIVQPTVASAKPDPAHSDTRRQRAHRTLSW